MWILFIVKISCQLRPVNLDRLSRKIATLAHALMMDKQLPVPLRPVCLRPGGSEVCYMITQVYGYQITRYVTIYISQIFNAFI